MTSRFRFQVNDIVTAKNLPIELTDRGFVNGIRYRVRFGWITELKQAYYIQSNDIQQVLQSADGMINGYASYFTLYESKKE